MATVAGGDETQEREAGLEKTRVEGESMSLPFPFHLGELGVWSPNWMGGRQSQATLSPQTKGGQILVITHSSLHVTKRNLCICRGLGFCVQVARA